MNKIQKFLNGIFSSNLRLYYDIRYESTPLPVYPLEKKLTLIDLILLFVPRGEKEIKKKKISARGLFVIYQASKGEYFIKGFFANLKTTLKICSEVLIDAPRALC